MNTSVLIRRSRFLSTTCLVVAGLAGCATPSAPPAAVPAPPAALAATTPEAPASATADTRPDPKALFKQLSGALGDLPAQVAEMDDGRIHITVPSDLSFALNQAEVGPDFAPVLDAMAHSLRNHPQATADIVGHTDSSGRAATNQALSLRRAENTRDALIARQVAPERLSVRGVGPDEPIADNRTAQGRAMNRRVEIFILPQ